MPSKYIWLAAFGAVLLVASPHTTLGQRDQGRSAIAPILKRRIQVLQEIVKLERQSFLQGESSLLQIGHAERELLEAQLELAETQQDRVGLLESMLENAKQREARVAEAVAQGRVSKATSLRAEADRLRAEAELRLAELGQHGNPQRKQGT